MSKYYDKTAASFKSVTIDTKVLDAQKILVKPSTGDSTERVNILDLISEAGESADTTELEQRISALEDLVEGYKYVEFKSNTTGNSNETEGIAMQFSKAHFIPGSSQLQQVSLPFTRAVKTLTNQYCHIVYYSDTEEVIATHISNTTQSRTQGQTGKSTWTFPESCIVPQSYKYVRVLLSGVDYAVNFGVTSKYRINVVNNNGVDFDDDECCVWTSTSNSPNYLGDIEVTYGVYETILDTINSVESDLNSRLGEITDELTNHIGDDTHLTTEQKNAISDYISSKNSFVTNSEVDAIQNQLQQLSQTDIQLSSQITSLQSQAGQIPELAEDIISIDSRVTALETGGAGGSGENSATTNCEYLKDKEEVEHHLSDEFSHLSFTDRIAVNTIYVEEEGNYSSYYNSNRIDNVTEFTDTNCSSFILHSPYILLNTKLGVLQIPYSGSADIQCKLNIVCRDTDNNIDLVNVTSTNTVDYSLGAGNANFFFQPFTLPFKTDEVICSFVKEDNTVATVPVKLITDSTVNDDKILNDSTYSNGRVYVIQYTPAVHITQFVRDLNDCKWPMLELLENGTYSVDYTSYRGMQSVSLTPHPETGSKIILDGSGVGLDNGFVAVVGQEPTFFFCLCKFTSTTEDAYVKINGHPLYTGAISVLSEEGATASHPFVIDTLLGPGDTVEISPYVQLRGIRFTGGKYV